MKLTHKQALKIVRDRAFHTALKAPDHLRHAVMAKNYQESGGARGKRRKTHSGEAGKKHGAHDHSGDGWRSTRL